MNYLLDTNICINQLRGKTKVLPEKVRALAPGQQIYINSITIAELWHGYEKSDKRSNDLMELVDFIDSFECKVFDMQAARAYGTIVADLERLGKPIGGNDSLIAAIGIANNLIVATNNLREFSRVPGLQCEAWI